MQSLFETIGSSTLRSTGDCRPSSVAPQPATVAGWLSKYWFCSSEVMGRHTAFILSANRISKQFKIMAFTPEYERMIESWGYRKSLWLICQLDHCRKLYLTRRGKYHKIGQRLTPVVKSFCAKNKWCISDFITEHSINFYWDFGQALCFI